MEPRSTPRARIRTSFITAPGLNTAAIPGWRDGLLDRLSCLAEPRLASDQQVTGGRLALSIAAPEEEPLDYFPQPILGLLRREEDGAGNWL